MSISFRRLASRLSLVWDRHKRPVKRLYQRPLISAAHIYRRLLRHPSFVAVTGSLGKTQTKSLIAAVLQRGGGLCFDPGTDNRTYDVARTLLRTPPWRDYCLQEIGMSGPHSMERPVQLFRPDIGVITNIRTDHGEEFKTREEHVLEKAWLINPIPETGWAILNADEPDLELLKTRTKARILTYGLSPHADIRGVRIIDEPPHPISVQVASDRETALVRTRLHGRHSAYAVLAAAAVARASGIPLQIAAEAIASASGMQGRMEYIEHDDGVRFLLDDFKSSVGSLKSIDDFLRASGPRHGSRFLVLGSIMYADDPEATYRRFIRQVKPSVQEILLVGSLVTEIFERSPPEGSRIFTGIRDAAGYLNPRLQPGDMVVLKGRLRLDHLRRIEMARRSAVDCWRMDCGRISFCGDCPFVNVSSE